MNQISTLKLGHLRNIEHQVFHAYVLEQLNNIDLSFLPENSFISNYAECLTQEKQRPTGARKSDYTQQALELRKKRHRYFRGLVESVRSQAKGLDAAKQEMADTVLYIIHRIHFGKKESESYENHTMEMLVNAAREDYANEFTQLGLTEWINHIDTLSHELKSMFSLRIHDIYSRPEYTLIEARRQVDEAFRDVRKFINGMVLFHNTDELQHTIALINLKIDHWQLVLAQRKGRARKKREAAIAEPQGEAASIE